MHALYIGLAATAVSYLYLMVVPFYAQQINQGAEADESLWWVAVRESRYLAPSGTFYVYALSFGIALSVAVIYKSWLPQASLGVNVAVMTGWLGILWLLARIDRLCFLLPDVLTQLLLWLGLLLMIMPLADTLVTVCTVYVMGRVINWVAFFCLQQPLFGLGDVKLVAALSAWLGWQAMMPLVFWACLSCVLIEALRQRRWRPRGVCAFGPYLVLGTLVVWVW